jgi:phytoene dehydrogenase-like protein
LTTNYYDAVVIGVETGPLTAGALLARRGFRVLVVGQNAPTDRYDCLGYQFVRRPFMLTSFDSPACRRVVSELRIGQLLQHALRVPSPAYQVILPKARVDVHGDLGLTRTEVAREFPAVHGSLDSFFGQLGLLNGEIEKLFANDLVLPPDSFMEKREFARAEVQNPFRRDWDIGLGTGGPAGRELEQFLDIPGRFETADTTMVSPLVRYRQMGGWLSDCRAIAGGRDGFRKLLLDQIVGQGGDYHPRRRVAEIGVRKGRVEGVRMVGREEFTGCRAVLTDLTPGEISTLIPPNTWTKRFRSQVEESPAALRGYGINLGLDREVVPEGLAETAFVSFGDGLGDELIRVERVRQTDEDKAALHVACVVPAGQESRIQSGALRDALLDRVRWLVPFLDKYLRVIHSPFDSFGPIDLSGIAEGDVPAVPHPEEVPQWLLRPLSQDGVLGIENLPHRTGIKGLLLAGGQVISGLGTEGAFIAAWGAARIAGKMDPRRERLVRSMRGKVEL